jgi:CBS domain containing-hemolysin-like protein
MVARLRLRRTRPDGNAPVVAVDDNGEDQAGRILSGLDDLRDMPVHEIMTPRVDVVGLPIPVTAADLARAVRQTGHSTFPVYDDDLDKLVGVLYARDLLRAGWEASETEAATPGRNGMAGAPGAMDGIDGGHAGTGAGALSPLDISRRIRKPYIVPESRLVLDVLASMRRDRRAFAVVVDEYGGVAGIVTIKDLLAALVGDLRDEFDRGGEPDVIRVDRARWLVDGGASVDDLRDQLGAPIPEGEYVTLGGFLLDVTGHIPEEGEQVTCGGWEYRVVEMDKRRVAKVVLRSLAGEAALPE